MGVKAWYVDWNDITTQSMLINLLQAVVTAEVKIKIDKTHNHLKKKSFQPKLNVIKPTNAGLIIGWSPVQICEGPPFLKQPTLFKVKA